MKIPFKSSAEYSFLQNVMICKIGWKALAVSFDSKECKEQITKKER